jgi:hypothetical protein
MDTHVMRRFVVAVGLSLPAALAGSDLVLVDAPPAECGQFQQPGFCQFHQRLRASSRYLDRSVVEEVLQRHREISLVRAGHHGRRHRAVRAPALGELREDCEPHPSLHRWLQENKAQPSSARPP